MQKQFNAIIVGAGPAGSSTAILLARAGWSVALVEKQNFPRRKVCGECIAASNFPLLSALGIGGELDGCLGPELRKVALMRGDRAVESDLPSNGQNSYPWGHAVSRESLDTLLRHRPAQKVFKFFNRGRFEPCKAERVTGAVTLLKHSLAQQPGWVPPLPLTHTVHGRLCLQTAGQGTAFTLQAICWLLKLTFSKPGNNRDCSQCFLFSEDMAEWWKVPKA